MEIIGVLSVLEEEPYLQVKRAWKLIQKKYHSKGVQSFSHPNLSFQGGKTNRLKELKREFPQLTMRVEPFEIRAAGLGDFNKKAIYVSVWKDHDLSKVNELVNSFLRGYCEELFESYVPT